jgi:hypothetical protein
LWSPRSRCWEARVVVRVRCCAWIEIRGRVKQQRSEKFYLQRRERKGLMDSCSGTQKHVVPWDRLEIGFYSFVIVRGWRFLHEWMPLWSEQMFLRKEKCLPGVNRCFLGRRRGIFPPNCHLLATRGPPTVRPSIANHEEYRITEQYYQLTL